MPHIQKCKEALNELALLEIHLEEIGGPSEDTVVYKEVVFMQTFILKSFGLPNSHDFLKLIHFENIPTEAEINLRIEHLKTAATNYLLADAKSEIKILEQAKTNRLSPLLVFPEINIRTHIYTIFVYDKIFITGKDSSENIWQELLLTRDPEVLLLTGKLGLKQYDFEPHLDYQKLLENKGLKYLEQFVVSQSELLGDIDY